MYTSILTRQRLFSRAAFPTIRRSLATTTASPLTSKASITPQPASTSLLGAQFPHRWLRDSCPCPSCVHPSTGQKLHRSTSIASNPKPLSETGFSTTVDKITGKEGIEIRWQEDGHTSFYPTDFLHSHSNHEALARSHRIMRSTQWTKNTLKTSPTLFIEYAALSTPSGLVDAISQLSQYGILFLRNMPMEQTSDDKCEVNALAEKFGIIRETMYGKIWDVRNIKVNSTNIAWTNLDLGIHMDILYLQHPPRYQILHCLRNRVYGGESYFVDALAPAREMQALHPEYFKLLTELPVPYHYINSSHHLVNSHPVIELESFHSPSEDGSGQFERAIKHVNFAPPFQAPLPVDTPAAFYDALSKFTSMLDDPARQFDYLLQEGDAVMFDNRRVLHARRAFSEIDGLQLGEGETNRWLKGCYVEPDSMLDKRRMLLRSIA